MLKSTRSQPRRQLRAATASLSGLLMMAVLLGGLTVGLGGLAVGLAEPAGAATSVQAKPGDTTTTLPEDHRVFGDSVTRPNQGMEPQDAGDPGGWLQSSLFFIICGAVIVMCCIVWYQSRNAREKRQAAGLDPVSVAKSSGKGVRAPSPLDKPADKAKDKSST
ncbi:MAG TPA: hypothetical protein VL068_02630 [Microthrixaceae bacterium]|nr:hypothetical protein [Microthrixaceae bacterium]